MASAHLLLHFNTLYNVGLFTNTKLCAGPGIALASIQPSGTMCWSRGGD